MEGHNAPIEEAALASVEKNAANSPQIDMATRSAMILLGMEPAYSPSMKYSEILVVDDDDDLRELCRQLLEMAGFSVETCANGQEALQFLNAHGQPRLIFLDMMMPIMDGREFMSAFVKGTQPTNPAQVYLVSATAENYHGREMGCRGFLKKPLSVEAMLAIAQTHCLNAG